MKISLLIAALDEAENMPHLLPRIPKTPEIAEVILIDGRSTDDTIAVAKALMPDIQVICQDRRGRGDAIRCGAKAASGDYLINLDADSSDRPEEIPLLIEKAREGYDVVKGSRYMKGGGTQDEAWDRFIMVRLTQFVTNTLWRTHYTDTVYGLWLIRRDRFLEMNLQARWNCLEHEMMGEATRRGLKVAEIPAFEDKRLHGRVKFSYLRDGSRIGWTVFSEAFKIWMDRLRFRRVSA